MRNRTMYSSNTIHAVRTRRNPSAEASSLKDFIPAFLLLTLSVLALSALALMPTPGQRTFAVIFPPDNAPRENLIAVSVADGSVLREGLFRNIVIARSDEDGFKERLYENAAWLVLDPISKFGCFTSGKVTASKQPRLTPRTS